ncbi:SDR family oxidoreductase [Shouchella sp. 1P09AA]|uniref:SDR family oxidoreductase n=1 Tax=unclassified Shouchella TaxID=2893065 RepID=UPI0039A1CA2C
MLQRETLPLKHKTILITGVSRRKGIGYAIARQCAAFGASIITQHYQAHDEQQDWGADSLEDVSAGIKAEFIEDATHTHYSANFEEEQAPATLFQAIAEQGAVVDAVVCNHAMSGNDGTLMEMNALSLSRHYTVNTQSSLLLAQQYVKQFNSKNGRGKVIFMTSGQELGPMRGEIAYAAAKGALASLTETIADELADHGVNVNTVNPGPVDTGYMTDDLWQSLKPKFPFGRMGEGEDPARLIAWLLTNEANWITGQVINTEGGFRRG